MSVILLYHICVIYLSCCSFVRDFSFLYILSCYFMLCFFLIVFLFFLFYFFFFFFFFFFQAEDGIRDTSVTGVQTCALPISLPHAYDGTPVQRLWCRRFSAGRFRFIRSYCLFGFSTNTRNRYPHSTDRKSTRLNSSHRCISYAVFCLKKKRKKQKEYIKNKQK